MDNYHLRDARSHLDSLRAWVVADLLLRGVEVTDQRIIRQTTKHGIDGVSVPSVLASVIVGICALVGVTAWLTDAMYGVNFAVTVIATLLSALLSLILAAASANLVLTLVRFAVTLLRVRHYQRSSFDAEALGRKLLDVLQKYEGDPESAVAFALGQRQFEIPVTPDGAVTMLASSAAMTAATAAVIASI